MTEHLHWAPRGIATCLLRLFSFDCMQSCSLPALFHRFEATRLGWRLNYCCREHILLYIIIIYTKYFYIYCKVVVSPKTWGTGFYRNIILQTCSIVDHCWPNWAAAFLYPLLERIKCKAVLAQLYHNSNLGTYRSPQC